MRYKSKLKLSHLIPIVIISFPSLTSMGQVKAWGDEIVIPTYGWEDDVNPN